MAGKKKSLKQLRSAVAKSLRALEENRKARRAVILKRLGRLQDAARKEQKNFNKVVAAYVHELKRQGKSAKSIKALLRCISPAC